MENEDKQSFMIIEKSRTEKLFIWFFIILICCSIFFTFYRFIVQKDYLIEGEADCDPTTEKCFIWQCTPDSSVNDEACTGNAEKDIWYYKLVQKKAANIPLCNPDEDKNCKPLACVPEEKDCMEIFCNEQNKIDQKAECNDPIQYQKDNPPKTDSENTTSSDETSGL